MAVIINSSTEAPAVSVFYSAWKIALVGAGLGTIHWGLTLLFKNFLSLAAAGDIATILVAATGVMVMLFLRMAQPLITAVAAGVALWGMSVWSDGLGWAVIVAWSVVLYCIAYTLFSWVARYVQPIVVVIAIAIIVILARVAASL